MTNLSQLPESQHQGFIEQSARNMVAVMERARAQHPSLMKVVILDQLPRTDSEHLSSLASTYNITLRKLVAAAPPSSLCQMMVASHDSLIPASQDPRLAVFGSASSRGTDGIHLRGREGKKRHTRSVISALKSTVLGGWTVQGRQEAGRQQRGQTPSQAVGTSTSTQC